MATRQVPVTITYRKSGTQPPIYVAGSFSDPPWQPEEMSHTVDEHGEHIFEKAITADEGSEIQFKFRIGPGDWWALNEEVPTVSDGQGNLNNVIRVQSIMPKGELQPPEDVVVEEDPGDDPPMFSHECVGTYEHPVTNGDTEQETSKEDGHIAQENSDYSEGKDASREDVNSDDPRLERFPSDSRESIMAQLQQIQTSTEEDQSVPEGIPPSPIVSPRPSSAGLLHVSPRRPDESLDSMGSLNLEALSNTSLQSIAETEENAGADDEPKTKVNGNATATDTSHVEPDGVAEENSSDETTTGLIHGVETNAAVPIHQPVQQAGPMQPVTMESPSSEDEGIAMSTTSSADSKTALLRKRNVNSRAGDRPSSPTSVHSFHEASKSGNWLSTFLRVLFVDWIGGLFSRLLRRKA